MNEDLRELADTIERICREEHRWANRSAAEALYETRRGIPVCRLDRDFVRNHPLLWSFQHCDKVRSYEGDTEYRYGSQRTRWMFDRKWRVVSRFDRWCTTFQDGVPCVNLALSDRDMIVPEWAARIDEAIAKFDLVRREREGLVGIPSNVKTFAPQGILAFRRCVRDRELRDAVLTLLDSGANAGEVMDLILAKEDWR